MITSLAKSARNVLKRQQRRLQSALKRIGLGHVVQGTVSMKVTGEVVAVKVSLTFWNLSAPMVFVVPQLLAAVLATARRNMLVESSFVVTSLDAESWDKQKPYEKLVSAA